MPEYPFHNLANERKADQYTLERLTSDDINTLRDQLKFELKHGIMDINDPNWIEEEAAKRQKEMRSGSAVIHVLKKDGEIVGGTGVILKSGTGGREFPDDTAWASGTLIREDLRSQGAGEKCAAIQEKVAREAGKKFVRTSIWNDNYSSMRFRMRRGYRLISAGNHKDGDAVRPYSKYRKSLVQKSLIEKHSVEETRQYLENERTSGRLPIVNSLETDLSNQVLVDPNNADLMNQVIEQGYVGVYLLTKKDVPIDDEIDKNYIVFVKAENLPENRQ